MASESVASCRQPSPGIPLPENPLPEKAEDVAVRKSSFNPVTNKGACFFCKEEGHWVRDCPRRPNPSPGGGSPAAARRSYPAVQCRCGHGDCIVRTSQTVKNPGRDFYCCPQNQSDLCNFFKWCDEATSELKSPKKFYQQQYDGINNTAKLAGHQGLKSPINHGKQLNGNNQSKLMCSCGAGECIVLMVHDGENTGRKYFACPIKKGQGACNHFEWLNSTTKADNNLNPSTPDNKQARKAVIIVEAEDAAAPVSPFLKQDKIEALQISPVKRLSLEDDGNPDAGSLKQKRCLRF